MEGLHDTRRLYHSRAARDDRAGAFPLQKVTSGQMSHTSGKQGGTVGRFYASPLTNQG